AARRRRHRHAQLPAPAAWPRARGHGGPAAHAPGAQARRARPHAPLPAAARGPVRRAGPRHERPEAGGRAGRAGRRARDRRAQGSGRRHDRRHPRPARAGARRRRHRHRRRAPRQRRDRRARPARLPRGRPSGGARAPPRPVGGRRCGLVRRRARAARRPDRGRRGRRRRLPARARARGRRRRGRAGAPGAVHRRAGRRGRADRGPLSARARLATRLRGVVRAAGRIHGAGADREVEMRFRSNPETIRGSIAPVVTPFTGDGALDADGLRRLIAWQLESGSHGISLGGSTGEPSAQTVDERIAAMRVASEAIADRVPFLPGTGSAKLDETMALTAAAGELGADACLVITPYYSRPTQEGLYRWYAAVAREFPQLPIVVYNVPSRTAVDVAPETVARLRRDFDNVVGIKETTRDFEHFSRVIHACGRDVLVWSGIELLCLPLLALGGLGFISAVANLAPAAVARMYELW